MLALSSMTTIQQRASVVRSPAGVAKDTSVDVGPVAVMSVVVTAAVAGGSSSGLLAHVY